jgi:site-specific DNA recombinase
MAWVRALLRPPGMIVGNWQAARADAPHITEAGTREALESLDRMWDELFPGEKARIVQAPVDRVTIGPIGVDIRLKVEGLNGLVQDLGPRRRLREAAC